MALIDQVVQHYKDTQSQSEEVPEWGITIHWKKLTVANFKKMATRAMDNVDVLAELATDETGNKLFDKEDKIKLRDCADAEIISRLAKKMLRLDTVEEATKN
jgi:predicted ATPase